MATKMKNKTTNTKAPGKAGKKLEKTTESKSKAKGEKEKKLGVLDAAAQVLKQTGQAMKCGELVEQMAAKGLWSSPAGKTPQATLHAAISREIKVKGKESRFTKTGPGQFASHS